MFKEKLIEGKKKRTCCHILCLAPTFYDKYDVSVRFDMRFPSIEPSCCGNFSFLRLWTYDYLRNFRTFLSWFPDDSNVTWLRNECVASPFQDLNSCGSCCYRVVKLRSNRVPVRSVICNYEMCSIKLYINRFNFSYVIYLPKPLSINKSARMIFHKSVAVRLAYFR